MSVNLTAPQRKIVEQIKHLHHHGKPLNISAVRESHPRLLLEVYSFKPFWGWRQALQAAGVDYATIKVKLPECVACRICGRELRVLDNHIRNNHGMAVQEYKAVYRGAETSSPAFNAIVRKSARLIIPQWEPDWTPEGVLDRIYELHRRGISLNSSDVKNAEPALLLQAVKYFRYWDTALQAIGIDPKTVRKTSARKNWTKQTVVKAVVGRYLRGGEVHRKAITEYDATLTAAVTRLFKGYDEMLIACGLDPDKIRKAPRSKRLYRTEGDVINGICRRRLQDKLLNQAAVMRGPDRDLPLWNKARRLFGSWREALCEAGFDSAKISAKASKYKGAKDILTEIRRRHDAGWSVTSMGVRQEPNRDRHLYGQAYKYFRDWVTAVKEAGIDYGNLHVPRGRYPSRESVIVEIKRRHSLGQPLGLKWVRKGADRNMALYDSSLVFFKNWATAVESAGVQDAEVKHHVSKYPTKEAVLIGIRERKEKGLPLLCGSLYIGQNADRALVGKAKQFFTHWKTAVEKVGVDYAALRIKKRKYASKDAVIAEIRRRFAAGLPLKSRPISKGLHRDSALYAAAKTEFGFWKEAIKASELH